MSRDRTLPSDFWTREAVIDCSMMARLLFLGLWNFADDHGVQPLRPRTIRMQVFPGDPIGDEEVRALIEELVARGLLRIFTAKGQDYVSVVHWEQVQRVGRRARHRHPADPAKPAPVEPVAPSPATAPAVADALRVPPYWREAIKRRLHKVWPGGPPADTERWAAQWLVEGHDLERDVLPAIDAVCRATANGEAPSGLQAVDARLESQSPAGTGKGDTDTKRLTH